jgi:TRAP-type C4-dicarboxylate transport system permease large subunit
MEHESIASELAKLSPPVVISAGAKFGWFTLQDWVCVATLIYTAVGIIYLCLKIRRAWKNRNK